MQQPPIQLLLLALDDATEALLSEAQARLQEGGCVVLVASCATSSSIRSLDQWYDLKNQYLEQLTLLFVLRDEPQLYAVLEGQLTAEHLAKLQPAVFDAHRLGKAIVAGPQQWVNTQCKELDTLGVDSQIIDPQVVEASNQITAASKSGQANPTATAVSVRVTLHGREFEFGMAQDGETVLDAAENAGLDLPYSCRGGVCSTCRTRVLEGHVTMLENSSLDSWELDNGYVLACQAVPDTDRLHISYDEV